MLLEIRFESWEMEEQKLQVCLILRYDSITIFRRRAELEAMSLQNLLLLVRIQIRKDSALVMKTNILVRVDLLTEGQITILGIFLNTSKLFRRVSKSSSNESKVGWHITSGSSNSKDLRIAFVQTISLWNAMPRISR